MVEGTNTKIDTFKAKIEAETKDLFREEDITQIKFIEAFKDFIAQVR